MAKDLRTRSIGFGLAAGIVAGTVLIRACRDGEQAPPPRTVDLAAIDDRDLVAAVLDECHKPLRGHMDRIAAKVRPVGGTEVHLFAILPDRLRVLDGNGSYLLCSDGVFRLGTAENPEATPAESARVRLFRTLLDAATFGPLHRATSCRRLGPREFELAQPEGAPCRLRLREHSLLPAMFASPAGEVRIVDYLHTPTTWIARQVELDGLGRCDVHFDLGGIEWAPDFFAPPNAAKSGRGPITRMNAPGAGAADPRSPVPVLVETRAARWVCIADAAGWTARVAAYRPVHLELEKQNQLITGFPIFWQEEGRAWIAAPFRQRNNGPALQAPKDWQLREVPAGRWLEVWPPAGSLDEKLAAGERLLREALQAQGLTATGPILAQPFLHLEEGEPPAEKLAAPVVRMAVAVR